MIKSLFSATLFVSTMLFAQAAQASAACSNVNLYTEMQRNDPTAYAKITAEADKTANGRGIFWKVSKEHNDHVSWLYGTMHKSDPRVTSLPRNVIAALDGVDTFAGEINSVDLNYEIGLIMGSAPELMFLPDGQRLGDKLSAQTIAQVDLILNERGFDFDQINSMQPWLSTTNLAFSLCDIQLGISDTGFLDIVMQNGARKAGKTIVGLELVREQIEAINKIDTNFFYKSLDDAAQQHRDGVFDQILQSVTELYLDEEIGVMLPLMMHYSHSLKSDDADMLSFQRKLLDDRNVGMVEKSALLFEQGPTFIAVGALHLVGETGLVEGLRYKGYTVERVKLER